MRWTVIRRGITRTVLLTRRYAIKIPALRTNGDGFSGLLWSLARGVLANQAELAWKEYEPWQDALCPIVWSSWGGLVVVMPRCEPLEVNHLGEFEGELPKLEPRTLVIIEKINPTPPQYPRAPGVPAKRPL